MAMAQVTERASGLISPKARMFLAEGVKVLGIALFKVVTRALAWGAFGLFVGLSVGLGLYLGGLLEYRRWEPWRYVVFVVVALYPISGAGLLGYIGALRGLGRTLLYLGVDRGLICYLAEKIIDRLAAIIAATPGVRVVAQKGEEVLYNLPLESAEKALKQAADAYLGSGDLEGEVTGIRRGVLRRVKGFLVDKIEHYLLTIVRAELSAAGGGGVSMGKVRVVAIEKSEGVVADIIVGMMNKWLVIGLLGLAVLYAIAPLVLRYAV